VFLRRKPSPVTSQTPVFAPSTPSPATATPAPGQSIAPQETIQQPAPQTAAPTPKIAPEKVMEATVTSETQSELAATIEVGKPDLESAPPAQAPSTQAILAHVDRISSTAKRIQAIKATLKSVMEQLDQDLTDLNKLMDERERALKNYFDTVREEVENAKTNVTDIEDTSYATAKPNFALDLAQEQISQAILTYRSRIASTEKRIQALNTVLKLEEEQFAQDVTEFNKAVNKQEKTLKNYFDTLRQEIEKLQTYLTDKQD
jgi:DNA repair exonuclease SbcCD ATPase subunit